MACIKIAHILNALALPIFFGTLLVKISHYYTIPGLLTWILITRYLRKIPQTYVVVRFIYQIHLNICHKTYSFLLHDQQIATTVSEMIVYLGCFHSIAKKSIVWFFKYESNYSVECWSLFCYKCVYNTVLQKLAYKNAQPEGPAMFQI